jgi:acyl dehydratase
VDGQSHQGREVTTTERTEGAVDKTTEAKMPEAVIDDAMIESMKARAGVNLRIDHSVNNEEATRIAVVKFAGGIGDINPLWTDGEYGTASDYAAPVAPPSFVIGCFSGIQFGWPGLGAFHNATQARFYKPVYWGDKIAATCRYDGFTGPRPSNFAGQMVTDHFVNSYQNQDGEVVAEIDWQVVNFERGSAKSRSKDAAKDASKPKLELPHPWTEDEILAVEEQVLKEKPRGAESRFWEDVEIGEALQTLTKGPIGLTDEVAFIAGGGTPIPRLKAHAASLVDYQAHPAWSFRDPVMGSSEPIYAVHYNKSAANAMGVAFQYDVGFQRQCWQTQLLTHWSGDDGWVRDCSSQYRGFVYLSDVVTLGGEVIAKSVADDGTYVVEVSTFARNQRGVDVMPGSAVIELPTRGQPSPVTRRARRA